MAICVAWHGVEPPFALEGDLLSGVIKTDRRLSFWLEENPKCPSSSLSSFSEIRGNKCVVEKVLENTSSFAAQFDIFQLRTHILASIASRCSILMPH